MTSNELDKNIKNSWIVYALTNGDTNHSSPRHLQKPYKLMVFTATVIQINKNHNHDITIKINIQIIKINHTIYIFQNISSILFKCRLTTLIC